MVRYTYMVPDLAYHRDKWERGFRTAIDVLGADHAGYPPRVRAGLVALGLPREFLDVELVGSSSSCGKASRSSSASGPATS